MKIRIALIALSTLVTWAGSSAYAGVTVTMQGKDPSTMYIEGNKMRVETSKGQDQPGTVMIFDGDAQKMIVTHPEKKTYTEITPQGMKEVRTSAQQQMRESMAKMTPEQRKQMEASLAKMDPKQRKQMEEMLSGSGGDSKSDKDGKAKAEKKEDIKWERTGTQQTVAGHRCEGFKELTNGKVDAQGCFIAWNEGAVTKADLAPMVKMQEFVSQAGWGGSTGESHRAFEKFANGPGFPGIWAHVSSTGEVQEEQKVTSIKRGGVSADKFQPPAGFSKVDMSSFGR